MFDAALNTGNERIPIRVTQADGETIFVECAETSAFLRYLTQSEYQAENLGTSVTVCGTVTPGHGASFELRDPFGTLIDDFLILDEKEVEELLLKHMELPSA